MYPVNKSTPESFDFQPVLKGIHVEVRPLLMDDRETLNSVASDPLIWEQHPSNRYKREEFETFFTESLASGGALLVIDTRTKAVIGSSRYHGYNNEKASVEIGWTFLARSHWGGKYNGELKLLMLNHAFEYVKTVNFYIDSNNERSKKSVEKIGAVCDNELDSKGRVVLRVKKSAFLNEN
ncbi:MAG: GNAT family N-acetyltransferase [Gammaproteobacteria bacterium]|nr:GNAT family N-acetyltransferase [Gammaproteobacteria bacterium]